MCFVLADNLLNNLLKKYVIRPRYRLSGGCLKCGQCCRAIYLKATRGQIASPLFCKIAVGWIEWLFDFKLKQIDREDHYFIFECRHLKENGSCGNYFWRPSVCRNFPLVDYFKAPVFLPGCGFTSEPAGQDLSSSATRPR